VFVSLLCLSLFEIWLLINQRINSMNVFHLMSFNIVIKCKLGFITSLNLHFIIILLWVLTRYCLWVSYRFILQFKVYCKFFQSRQQQLIPYWIATVELREERHCFQKIINKYSSNLKISFGNYVFHNPVFSTYEELHFFLHIFL
jgi:hypothetical protein